MSFSRWENEEYDFNQIYEEHWIPLQRFLLRLTRNPDDAADLLQETFLRYYEQRVHPHCTKAWLNLTGYRLFVDQWRRKQRNPWVELDTSPLFSCEQTPEQTFIEKEIKSTIEESLNRLPAQIRMIFMLRTNEHASYKKIGFKLGCPENTIKSLVRRARIHLSLSPLIKERG